MFHQAFHTLTLPLGHQHPEIQTIHTVCHLVAPLGQRCLFTFESTDWNLCLFLCLFVWLAVSRLGFPMMIMTCMIGMCYLLATHVGLGWNMWVRGGGGERERERSWDRWRPSARRCVASGLDWVSLQAELEATWRRRLEGRRCFQSFQGRLGTGQ